MTKSKRILSVVMSALMLVFTCMTYVPASAAEVTTSAPVVAFVGVDHSPLVVGDTESFSFTTNNADSVMYKAIVKDAKGNVVDDLTKGYTTAVPGTTPYEVKGTYAYALGKYTLTVYAKRVSDSKEVSYTANLNCVTKDNANRIYANGDMIVDKTTVTAGEKITVSGVKDLAGIAGPYKYRLHVFNATTGVWTNNVVASYGDKIEWTPTVAGTYVLDVHINSEKSTTWAKYLANPTSSTVYGTYEAWKLKTVVVNPAPTPLTVQTVSALNAKQVQVKFTSILDKATAESVGNYTIAGSNSDAVAAPTITKAELQDDKTTVVLTLGTTLNKKAAANYLVRVNGVKAFDGQKIAEFSNILNMSDTTAPTVTGITYTDSNTVKVTFSEPVNTISTGIASATTIKLDGSTVVVPSGAYTIASDYASFKINVPTSGLLRDKNYTIAVSGLTDFAGNALTSFSGTVNVATDSVNPTVSELTSVSTGYLKVVFSEKIYNNTFLVKVDGAAVASTITNPDADGKTFYAQLAVPATAGNHIVTVYSYQDLSLNPTNASLSSYTKELTFKDTKPTVTNTAGTIRTIGGVNYVVYTFDRDVTVASASVNSVYVKNGVTIAANGLTLLDSTTVTALEDNEIAINTSALVGGAYTVTLAADKVVDSFGLKNATTYLTFNYDATIVATTISSVTPNGLGGGTTTSLNKVEFVFANDVSDEALNVTHYTVDGVQVFKSAIFNADRQHVKLTLNAGAIATTGAKIIAVSGITNVTDKTWDGVGTNPAKVTLTENVVPSVTKVELVALDKIRVTFSEDIVNVDTADFIVKVNGSVVPSNKVTPVENNGVVVLTLDPAYKLASSTTPVAVALDDDNCNIQDVTGNYADTGALATPTVNFADLSGIAQTSVDVAKAQFDVNGALTGTATAATARAKYDAAVTACNDAGLSGTTYAADLANLKAEVTLAEAEYFAATADLTIADNYSSMFTTASTNKVAVATAAKDAMGAGALQTALATRITALGTTEKGKIDTAIADYATANTAINTAVTTNTAANLAAAAAATTTANASVAAMTTLSQATKTVLTSNMTTAKAKITSTVANIKLVGGANPITATWGSDNGALAVSAANLTLAITPATVNTGKNITISATGTVAISGNPDATANVTITATHAVFTGASQVKNVTGTIDTSSVITLGL